MEAERRVGVAMDFSPCSHRALKWTLDNIIRDGDNLILLIVRPEQKSEGNEMLPREATGSPLIPFKDLSDHVLLKKCGVDPDPTTIGILQAVTTQKNVMVHMKIYWGSPGMKLCESIDQLPLTSIILGYRGHGMLESSLVISGSSILIVSSGAFRIFSLNYQVANGECLVNNGACPVSVVKEYR